MCKQVIPEGMDPELLESLGLALAGSYNALQFISIKVLQGIAKHFKIITKSITKHYKVLQSIPKYGKVWQSVSKYYKSTTK